MLTKTKNGRPEIEKETHFLETIYWKKKKKKNSSEHGFTTKKQGKTKNWKKITSALRNCDSFSRFTHVLWVSILNLITVKS